MKKIKDLVKKNYKLVIGIILGIIVCIGMGVGAVATKEVVYDNSKSGLTSTNLQGAIDELNTKATTKINEAKKECPDGYTCVLGFVPTYFAFGTPTTSSTTDYTTLGKVEFIGLASDGTTKGVCINGGGLFCIKANDYENSVAALKVHFGESICTDSGSNFSCWNNNENFGCMADEDGSVRCASSSNSDGFFEICAIDLNGNPHCCDTC